MSLPLMDHQASQASHVSHSTQKSRNFLKNPVLVWTGLAVLCLLLVAAVALAVYFATRTCPTETSCQSSCQATWDAASKTCVNNIAQCSSTCKGDWDAQNSICNKTVSSDCKDACTSPGLQWQASTSTSSNGTCKIDFDELTGQTGRFVTPPGQTTQVCVANSEACKANTKYDNASNSCVSSVSCQDSCNSYGVEWAPSTSPTSGTCNVDVTKLVGQTGEFTKTSTPKCEASSASCQGGQFDTSVHVCTVAPQEKVTQEQCNSMSRTKWTTGTTGTDGTCSGDCTQCIPYDKTKNTKTTADPSTWVSCGLEGCIGSLVINKNYTCEYNTVPKVGVQPSLDAMLDSIKANAPAPEKGNAYAISILVDPSKESPQLGSHTYEVCQQTAIGSNSFEPMPPGGSHAYGVVLNPFGKVYSPPSASVVNASSV